MAQMKKAKPAVGTKNALTVKRWRILCTGNQIAGKLPSQNRKKLTKATVFVPEEGIPFGTPPGRPLSVGSRHSSHILRIMRYTQVPPIQDCTPYHIQAIAARLKTGHRAPQIPNEARFTTGKEMW
jgi:hypothetical protein